MQINYELRRRKEIVSKAKEFLGNSEVVLLKDVKGNIDYLTLNYYGEPTKTEIGALEIANGKVYLWSYSESYPDDGKSLDEFSEFSNDEMKRILELFDIDF